MNELQIFSNSEFGDIRIVEIKGKPYAVGNDIANALEYAKPYKAISDHCKGALTWGVPTNGGNQEMKVIPEGDIYRLIVKAADQSRNPKIKEKAERFESWIFDEVLPTLRKTGTYSINPVPKEDAQLARAKAMLLNAKTRAAQTWLKIAATVNIPEYKQIASTYAANTLADREVLALPQVERKTYTATEIGKMFDVSGKKIGQLANEHGLKTKEYGMEVWDKARHSGKQIPAWRYYENAIPVFAKLLGREVA